MEGKNKPYSKHYGQGEPEWRCPACKKPIPDDQEELRCLHCEAQLEAPGPAVDPPWLERFHLLQLQRHIHRAIGRTVPLQQIVEMLKALESDAAEPG